MRSVVVVLPASMCAEIPMFRYRSMGVLRAMMCLSLQWAQARSRRARTFRIWGRFLEAEVAEGLVRLGHAVHFVALLHRAATAFRGFHQFVGQAHGHRLLAALLG